MVGEIVVVHVPHDDVENVRNDGTELCPSESLTTKRI